MQRAVEIQNTLYFGRNFIEAVNDTLKELLEYKYREVDGMAHAHRYKKPRKLYFIRQHFANDVL